MIKEKDARIYILGAGFAGRSLARELKKARVFGDLVAFLDDDRAKIGSNIDNIPVLGPIADITRLLAIRPQDIAFIAIPSADRETIRRIYSLVKNAGFKDIRILPGIAQIIEGEGHLIQTRSMDPRDLLSRKPINIGLKESLAYLRGKRVFLSGAGGSIGGEIARQLLSGGAERLYLFGHGENSIYEIDRELRLLQEKGVGEKASIVPIIGELKDSHYMNYIMAQVKADVVFHAAAYKHVPMMEENPVAAIENNVLGTENLIHASKAAGVKRFVLISTDKAVDPVSVYGVSKRLCEELVLKESLQTNKNSYYMVVRFGNVLASRGSIVPLFQRQIETGGPVTVTHPQAKRWFMTIPEACSLVLKAGGVGKNASLYLLDMGEPVLIKELAEQMISFYGHRPEKDIKIEYIGLRPGERLEEHLWGAEEKPEKTEYHGIQQVRNSKLHDNLPSLLCELRDICQFNPKNPEAYRNSRQLHALLRKTFTQIIIPDNERDY